MSWNIPPQIDAALEHLRRPMNKDPLAWAHRILDKHNTGRHVSPATLKLACEALRIPIPPKPTKDPHGNP